MDCCHPDGSEKDLAERWSNLSVAQNTLCIQAAKETQKPFEWNAQAGLKKPLRTCTGNVLSHLIEKRGGAQDILSDPRQPRVNADARGGGLE